MNMHIACTEEVLRKLTDHYNQHYRYLFNEYGVDLEFKTILIYYSGICGVVVECSSLHGMNVNTCMCLVIDFNQNALFEMEEWALDKLLRDEILCKYQRVLSIHKELCNRHFTRKIVLKNSNFKESVLNIKMTIDEIILELNNNFVGIIKEDDQDLYQILSGLGKYLELQSSF